LVDGSIFASPRVLQVAVQTAPKPTSDASHGPCLTGIAAFRQPVLGSSRNTSESPLSQMPPSPAASQSPLMKIFSAPAFSTFVSATAAGVFVAVAVAMRGSRPPH